MHERFNDICIRKSYDKTEAAESMKTSNVGEVYKASARFKLTSPEERAKKLEESRKSLIKNNSMNYLNAFIKYTRETPYLMCENPPTINKNDKTNPIYYNVILENSTPDYDRISLNVGSIIFNMNVWKFIIKNYLNHESIKELYKLLIEPKMDIGWLNKRVDKNGEKRFIDDVKVFNPDMISDVLKMFECIKHNVKF